MSEHGSSDESALRTMFGPLGAVWSAGAFGAAAYLVTESAPLAIVLASLTGVGSYFLFPWITSLEETTDAEERSADAEGRTTDAGNDSMGATTTGGFELHRGAAGVACETGAVLGFAAYFVLEEPLLAAGVGVGAALVEYPILSLVLPEGQN